MITRAHTVTFEGMEPREVDVECAISPGLPGFAIVGLPDKAVSEARERIRAGSVENIRGYRINSGCWTHLFSESCKLLEWAMSGCFKLLLSDHMCNFDTVQCCQG